MNLIINFLKCVTVLFFFVFALPIVNQSILYGASNMTLRNEILSDKQIITMLQEDDPLAWESLYDKYASAIYGLIRNLTDDKLLVEQIFINVFIQFKKKDTLSKTASPLYAVLLRHTYAYTTTYLKQVGISPKTLNPPNDTKIIHLLTTQCNSIKETASILGITVEETKKRLHKEFLRLRMQNNIPVDIY